MDNDGACFYIPHANRTWASKIVCGQMVKRWSQIAEMMYELEEFSSFLDDSGVLN
jgi:hypothetical protein